MSVPQPPETKQLTPISRSNLNAVLKALRAKGAEPRDEDYIVDVDASKNFRGVRKNASPCMLAARNSGFWVTSRARRLTLAEASRLQGVEPLTSRVLSTSQLFGLLGNAVTQTVVVELLRATLISLGVTKFPDEKRQVTVSDRRPNAFNVPVGSRLYKIRGPRPYTYPEEGGVPHVQTFKGDAPEEKHQTAEPCLEAPKETAAVTVAVSSLGPPERCEICDSDVGWAQRARPGNHEQGILGRCRQCDWHLCSVCCDQRARCLCLTH